MNATITATAHYVPKKTLTNYDLEKFLDTSDEWIKSRTGIMKRHIVDETEATSDLCTNIANKLLKKRGLSPKEIDMIIISTCTPDFFAPSTASIVQKNIGASNAWGFDLNAACTGFLYGLETGAKFIESKKYKKIIVIGADAMSTIMDYEDRNVCILFGDGGGGVVLERSSQEGGIIDSILRMDGSGGEYLMMPGGGSRNPATLDSVKSKKHYLRQDGKTVYKFAVNGMADVSKEILDQNKLSPNDIKLFIPHQANKRIINATANRCELNENQILINIDKYGNTTAGTIPIGINEASENGRLNDGDLLLLAAFGAGFTWGSMLIQWNTNP